MRDTFRKLNTRLLALVMTAMLLLSVVPAVSAAESGTCGSGLNWTFADGTLTISGSGAMEDYSEWNFAPWYEFRDEILWLSLPEGLTTVGSMAFYDCVNITAVTLPGSVTSVGEMAFCQNRSMAVLSLNSGLTTIGRSAFERCEALPDLRLPNTVTSIGDNAFYFCTSLSYVTVPASVTRMGTSTFAYCTGLVRADIEAPLTTLPAWTFYGCDNLTSVAMAKDDMKTDTYAFQGCDKLFTVHVGDESVDADSLKQEISKDIPGFDSFAEVQNQNSNKGEVTYITTGGENTTGDYVVSNSSVIKTDNSTGTTTVDQMVSATGDVTNVVSITETIVNPEGWNELLDLIIPGASQHDAQEPINITVYISGADTEVPAGVLDSLRGMNVTLNVLTDDGGKFSVNCADLSKDMVKKGMTLSYTLSLMENPPAKFEGAATYRVTFHGSGSTDTEVMIRLPGEVARKTASLYQMTGGDAQFVQAALVDDEGYAHFYLARVDEKTEYLIGIDVPEAESGKPVIPGNLQNNYGVTYEADGVQYVITGTKSSWNMDIGQVTWIMAGGMAAAVIVIGIIMYMLNKRKLSMGYVPDIDDETL